MQILLSVIVSIISGVVASSIFLLVLFSIKPKIKVSDFISVDKTDPNNRLYRLKIINMSKDSLINVKFQCYIETVENDPGGKVISRRDIHLKKNEIFQLAGYSKNDDQGKYAIRVTIGEDLESKWVNDKIESVFLLVSATHSVSNFSTVFEKRYFTKRNTIKEGSFEFGKSLNVS